MLLSLPLALALAAVPPPPLPRLALLLAAPHAEETAMHNDVVAMRQALGRRGYRDDEIRVLEGRLTRGQVEELLAEASREIRTWEGGSVFLYYTGHGSLTSADPETARAVLQFDGVLPKDSNRQDWISWDEVLQTLQAPPSVHVVLLPDS